MVQSQQSEPKTNHVVAPFRGDHVGSLLRSDRIKWARIQKITGELTSDELRLIEDAEITRIVEKQKEVGLQAVTDGEFRRAWWHFDFLENLEGVEGYESDSGIQFHGTKTKAHAIKVTGKINFHNHPMLEHYKFLHNIAGSHTAKMTIPSPNMLYFRGDFENDLYDDQDLLLRDLTQAYQKAIQAFYDAGCRYLQLDDTSWSLFFSEHGHEQIRAKGQEPEQLQQFFAKLINTSIAKKPADMRITMHICRGNFKSTYAASGGYDAVSETLFDGLDVDGLFLEYDDERSGGFEPLRYVKRPDLQLVLGLVTSKFGELEDPELVKRRIDKAASFVNINQLCLSPQCGFASTEEGNILSEKEQWEKLRHVVTIANEVWK
ncbi:5-methyltetrahydropteroyltriglutamate--homocysteine methyltransferase [Virgibacillus phasianinus]|uniref:5-methyltetrahydropteroyltriglutamate--homocysteine methyltransferase n=1 Tax=Virgibacillus phasianinus TaxID=2017483 RepID=A0A220TZ81_9BACI|nr:5-methyltetrahydropteroyltriglutamate--homocysteine S-methyltransferase [Virgibacillus phasianinus]ASK60986.1 5-methyltetrahydropteroyltriglutamate--homocysteine methyltransferase [Virgibacillus phasianinus]